MLSLRKFTQKPLENQARQMTTEVAPVIYPSAMRWLHLVMGGGILTTFTLVKSAQWTKDEAKKGKLMFYHKSTGLLMLPLIALRTWIALKSRTPAPLPSNTLAELGANLSHKAMYAMMWFMPITGIIMGIYGGRGLPFYFTTIPGKSKAQPSISKPAWQYHKLVGQIFEFVVPIHLLGSAYHISKGQTILARMNPLL